MAFLQFVKRRLTRLPFVIGSNVSTIPYRWRPGVGGAYKKAQQELDSDSKQELAQRKKTIAAKVFNIASYAYDNIPFYADLYCRENVNPKRLKCFEEIEVLPVVEKKQLQAVPLEYRSAPFFKRYLVNTGGSSGFPLEFYITPYSVGHEWAHMHALWGKIGFKYSDLKVSFTGRSTVRGAVEYDSARNHFSVNIYDEWKHVADSLFILFKKVKIQYLHGYPSVIFDFILWMKETSHPLLDVFQQNIIGLLLGSEFPSPQLRDYVEGLLDCGSISWYGHTERAVLAYEQDQNSYVPFASYGFAESVQRTEYHSLTATNYWNYASPLVRYNTGDLITPTINSGLLTSFAIEEGRTGEYIIDKHGQKIFLTGLIFGRHHELFNSCRHIQVYQKTPGEATVRVVTRDTHLPHNMSELFDSDNVDITFSFKKSSFPYRTPAGKVPLLIPEL